MIRFGCSTWDRWSGCGCLPFPFPFPPSPNICVFVGGPPKSFSLCRFLYKVSLSWLQIQAGVVTAQLFEMLRTVSSSAETFVSAKLMANNVLRRHVAVPRCTVRCVHFHLLFLHGWGCTPRLYQGTLSRAGFCISSFYLMSYYYTIPRCEVALPALTCVVFS